MMKLVSGDLAMNLIGLILIAALSGFIVAVSLRLRSRESPAAVWLEGELSLEHEVNQQVSTGGDWTGRAV